MDSQILAQASGYIALGVVGWSFCKYVLGPVFTNKYGLETMNHLFTLYERSHRTTIEQRAKVVTELGKTGRSKEEISALLDLTLPLPNEPEL